ncbi:MAG: hypothetical protein B7C24_07230 [Bacteroidetes bacterium 4572_77]|nr:MAG: hypothetical protein B7C24_07230 [Bacteroidetes bacterium 4572_77]
MLSTIFIITLVAAGGYFGLRLLKKNDPKMHVYRKHYSCSVCNSEYDQTLDYCPKCAKERQTTVLLHEFFVEVSPG